MTCDGLNRVCVCVAMVFCVWGMWDVRRLVDLCEVSQMRYAEWNEICSLGNVCVLTGQRGRGGRVRHLGGVGALHVGVGAVSDAPLEHLLHPSHQEDVRVGTRHREHPLHRALSFSITPYAPVQTHRPYSSHTVFKDIITPTQAVKTRSNLKNEPGPALKHCNHVNIHTYVYSYI